MAGKWKVLCAVVAGTFLVVLDTTVVNVAFPTLRGELRASLGAAQWIVSIYVMAIGMAMPVAGFLGERFGLRRVYTAGLVIFVLGSIAAGLSPSLGTLVGARALQGIGGGLAQSLASAMLFRAFPKKEQGSAFGVFGIALLVAPALGPLLGGTLVYFGAWRSIFFLNVPVGVVGVALAFWLLKGNVVEPDRADVTLDVPGLALATLGFGGVLFGAARAEEGGFTSATVIGGLAIGAVALAAFAVVELRRAKRGKTPLLDLHLYRDRVFLAASIVGYIAVAALFSAEFLVPIYLQLLRGETALATGVILLPLGITAGIVTPIAGRIYDRIGPRWIAITGFLVLAVNTWQLSKLDAHTSIAWIAMLLSLRGFALGCTLQSTLTAALGAVPNEKLPRGSSLVNATRRAVQSIGVAALATVLVSPVSTQEKATAQAAQEAEARSPRSTAELALCAGDAADAHTRGACDAYLTGFQHAYRITFAFSLLAVGASAFLPSAHRRDRRRAAAGAQGQTTAA